MFGRVVTSLIVVLALACPTEGSAHAVVQPAEVAEGAYTLLHVAVPSESDEMTTTRVEVRFPVGYTWALYRVPGWSVNAKTMNPAKSTIGGQEIPERVRVIWTARNRRAQIQPRKFEDFPVVMQIPGKAGDTLIFQVVQTYEDGRVARWVGGPGSPAPAPRVLVTAADGQGAAASENEPAEDSGGDGDGLAIAALIVAILGLAAGGAALIGVVQRR